MFNKKLPNRDDKKYSAECVKKSVKLQQKKSRQIATAKNVLGKCLKKFVKSQKKCSKKCPKKNCQIVICNEKSHQRILTRKNTHKFVEFRISFHEEINLLTFKIWIVSPFLLVLMNFSR